MIFEYDFGPLRFQHAETIEELLWAHSIFNPECKPAKVQYLNCIVHEIKLGDGRFCVVRTDLESGETVVSNWEKVQP